MLAAQLQAIVDRDVRPGPRCPLVCYMCSRRLEASTSRSPPASPTARPASRSLPGSRFRIASVTKSFVGPRHCGWWRPGALDLDASLDVAAADESTEVLRGGGYDTAIDHPPTPDDATRAASTTSRPRPTTPRSPTGSTQAIAADPTHRWTRLGAVAVRGRPWRAVRPPGAVYGYCDTNANLVGEVLELETGGSHGRRDPSSSSGTSGSGLRHTYQESIEPEPADLPPWSHQYERDVDIARRSIRRSTSSAAAVWCRRARDLARFFRALLRGEVFERSGDARHDDDALVGRARRRRLRHRRRSRRRRACSCSGPAGGDEWWGHDGWWGTTAYTCPALDLTVVAGHQQAYMPKDFDRMADPRRGARGLLDAD